MIRYIDAATTADEAAQIAIYSLRRDLGDQDGAIDFDECPKRLGHRGQSCHCGVCAVCGEAKHTAIHGPYDGQPPGSRPWGHRYRPCDD